jgi:hypothetical protein
MEKENRNMKTHYVIYGTENYQYLSSRGKIQDKPELMSEKQAKYLQGKSCACQACSVEEYPLTKKEIELMEK